MAKNVIYLDVTDGAKEFLDTIKMFIKKVKELEARIEHLEKDRKTSGLMEGE